MPKFDDVPDTSEEEACGPKEPTYRRCSLDELEEAAIAEWRQTGGHASIVATLFYKGVAVGRISAATAVGIEEPVQFAFSVGLADKVAIVHLCKITIRANEDEDEDEDRVRDPGLVFATAEGMDAIILLVAATNERTVQRVLMVARYEGDWMFERLGAIEDGTKVLFASEPLLEPPHDWFELTSQRREEAWEVIEGKQHTGFWLERLDDI